MVDTNVELYSELWAATPEPDKHEGDLDAEAFSVAKSRKLRFRNPQTIVETGPVAFVWNSQNETGEWLHFHGEPMDIER